jgi:hypothetical protein
MLGLLAALGGLKEADVLIQIATDDADLFHSSDMTGYADLKVNGHRETVPIKSKAFRRWLARQFYNMERSAPGSEATASALNVIEAKAAFDGLERKVFTRIAGDGGKIYLDMCDAEWRALEIDINGWRLIDEPPVRFRRAPGMRALPLPVAGGSVEGLRKLLNVTDADLILVVAWLLAALRDRGPYPVLVLAGEQGSGQELAQQNFAVAD